MSVASRPWGMNIPGHYESDRTLEGKAGTLLMFPGATLLAAK